VSEISFQLIHATLCEYNFSQASQSILYINKRNFKTTCFGCLHFLLWKI